MLTRFSIYMWQFMQMWQFYTTHLQSKVISVKRVKSNIRKLNRSLLDYVPFAPSSLMPCYSTKQPLSIKYFILNSAITVIIQSLNIFCTPLGSVSNTNTRFCTPLGSVSNTNTRFCAEYSFSIFGIDYFNGYTFIIIIINIVISIIIINKFKFVLLLDFKNSTK